MSVRRSVTTIQQVQVSKYKSAITTQQLQQFADPFINHAKHSLQRKPTGARNMKRFRSMLRNVTLSAAIGASAVTAITAQAADTIKVGVLHSLSGTMAISETTLKDTVLMMI